MPSSEQNLKKKYIHTEVRLQSIKDKEKPLMDMRKVGRSGHVCNLSSEDHLQLRSDPAPEAKQKITHKETRQTGAFVGHNRESRRQIKSSLECGEKRSSTQLKQSL